MVTSFLFFLPAGLFFLFWLTATALTGCNNIRPEQRYGSVIDDSRILSVALYFRSSDPDVPPDTLLVRRFHYFVRPSPWEVTTSGTNRPITVFEEMAVYALTIRGLARLARLPRYHGDGDTRLVQVVVRPQVPIPFGLDVKPRFLVYVEGGPIYGGIDLDGDLSPENTVERSLSLMADGHVNRADLALDGESIVFIDQNRRVFAFPKGAALPAIVADLYDRTAAWAVKGIRWGGSSLDTALLLVDRGIGGDGVYRLDVNTGGFGFVGGNPSSPTNVTDSVLLDAIERRSRGFSYADWRVPDPETFAE
ncbi:MAG: hypothetical protein FJY97_00370 [candidate division Zixibacteria bacterium]|nr:hypothetical protein [candidate division Zixibacteria bacterium]